MRTHYHPWMPKVAEDVLAPLDGQRHIASFKSLKAVYPPSDGESCVLTFGRSGVEMHSHLGVSKRTLSSLDEKRGQRCILIFGHAKVGAYLFIMGIFCLYRSYHFIPNRVT